MSTKRWTAAGAVVALAALGAFYTLRADGAVPLEKLSHIHGLAVDPQNPLRLLVATHEGVFAASPDGTATPVSSARHDFMGFTPHPTEAGTFVGSGHPATGGNLGFIKSTDGGRSWDQVSEGYRGPVDFHVMEVSKADPKVIYGVHGTLQASRDGGQSWAPVGPAPEKLIDLAASAKDPGRLYAATEAGLQISRDSGKSWAPASPDRRPVSTIHVTRDGQVLAYVVGLGVVKGADPLLGFQTLGQPRGARYLVHLTVDEADPRRLFAVDDKGAIVASRDGGATWDALAK